MIENSKLPEITWECCLVIIIIRDVHCPCKVDGPCDAQNQNSSSRGWYKPSLINLVISENRIYLGTENLGVKPSTVLSNLNPIPDDKSS